MRTVPQNHPRRGSQENNLTQDANMNLHDLRAAKNLLSGVCEEPDAETSGLAVVLAIATAYRALPIHSRPKVVAFLKHLSLHDVPEALDRLKIGNTA